MFLPGVDPSGILVKPEFASRNIEYKCIGCSELLLLRKGEVNRPHFAHRSDSNCSESIYHLAAKNLLCQYLQHGGVINVRLTCTVCKTVGYHKILGKDAITEYRMGDIIPDIYCSGTIIEIYHTHRQNNRPEPWYEFRAKDVLESESTIIDDVRLDRVCDTCVKKSKCRGDCHKKLDTGEYTIVCRRCKGMFPERMIYRGLCSNCAIPSECSRPKRTKKPKCRKRRYCGFCKTYDVKMRKFPNCKHKACSECHKKEISCVYCSKCLQ